jgi:ankyrin repeat protein
MLCRDAVEVCIDAGAQVNEPVDGLTPLLIACYKGHVSVVERLLETGQADVNMCALDGTTPLFIAAHRCVVPSFIFLNSPLFFSLFGWC